MYIAESTEYVPPRKVIRVLVCRYVVNDDGDYQYTANGERITELSSSPTPEYDPLHEHGSRPIYDHRPDLFSSCPPRAPSSANLDRFTEIGHEQDRKLDEIIRARPRQSSADEVGAKVQSLLKRGKQKYKRDAIHDFLLRALAFACFGLWPSDPTEVAAQRAAMRDCAAFGSLRDMLQVYAVGSPELGRGSITYHVAESTGRTNARWDEIKCQPTHSGGSAARGVESVDRFLDAQAAIKKAKLSPLEHAMLEAWLLDPPRNEDGRINWTVLLMHWRLLTWRSNGGVPKADRDKSFAIACEATKDISDRALKAGMTRLRTRIENELSRPSELSQRMASEMVEPIVARPILRHRQQTHRPAHRTFAPTRFGTQSAFSIGGI